MKIAILTTPNQWFVSYAKELQGKLIDSKLFFDHKDQLLIKKLINLKDSNKDFSLISIHLLT